MTDNANRCANCSFDLQASVRLFIESMESEQIRMFVLGDSRTELMPRVARSRRIEVGWLHRLCRHATSIGGWLM